MDDTETKSCSNCKREIPAVNFTIHSVHCARNIKVCPVCKEPVPLADLQLHHDQMHKLLPCKKCGESVCGTDLEDHIRDSCAHTIKSCKFCSLELARRELPTHEGYCGARTEQCPDCREWVMLKYRQLHLDSNHGFLRLNDDPDPKPTKNEVPKSRIPKVPNPVASPFNGLKNNVNMNGPSSSIGTPNLPSTSAVNRIRNLPLSSDSGQNVPSTSNDSLEGNHARSKKDTVKNTNAMRDRQVQNMMMTNNPPRTEIRRINPGSSSESSDASRPKNTNQVQENANQNSTALKSNFRGAVKKRAAPQPPEADPRRDLTFYSALQRQQDEARQRQEINTERLKQGLPPLPSPAEKVEKLRKMDALHNREQEVDYSNRLQGRVWGGDPTISAGNRIGRSPQRNDLRELRDLKPMSPEQFMRRFSALQMGEGEGGREAREERRVDNDRFSMIKSSLRELRRGLNEVTAPYNSNQIAPAANEPLPDLAAAIVVPQEPLHQEMDSDPDDDVRLPCEFCGLPQPMDILVQHQTGCRPDLARLLPGPAEARPDVAEGAGPPVIPCEFCAQSLPVYLISEHQERCSREANPLYLD